MRSAEEKRREAEAQRKQAEEMRALLVARLSGDERKRREVEAAWQPVTRRHGTGG